jgi:formiminoglutamate deiminase
VWCELAWLGGERAEAGVLIEIEDDRFATVTAGVPTPSPTDAERLDGLVLPGFTDAHSHTFHRALRGRTHSGRGTFWTWREQMYALAARLDPDTYRALATATFAESLLAGVTTVGEFHYLHHGAGGQRYEDPNEMAHALTAGANDAGVRLTLLDTCYLRGGFDQPLDEVQRRFADADADDWGSRVDVLKDTDGCRVGAAIHSVRAVDSEAIAAVSRWAAQRGAPVHAHVSEQPAENEACLAATGRTPIQLLAGAGAMSPRFTAVHATHLTDIDISLLGTTGSCACLCPTTERDLADGIGPAARLAVEGASIALGSDSRAVVDHFEEARAVELDERLSTLQRGCLQPAQLLGAATAGGAWSLGWYGAGRIAPGAVADLVVVDLATVRLAGTDASSAVAAVTFAATAADVRHVMVGGRWLVQDSVHTSIDVPAALATTIGALWP